VPTELIAWAAERSRIDEGELRDRFPQFVDWLAGERQPTLRQLENFAQATATPVGYFFLAEPPEEPLPIRDFRRMTAAARRPTPDLLDTIYQCQQRQEWYRLYAEAVGFNPLGFVEAFTTNTPPVEGATQMRAALGFGLEQRGNTWSDAFRRLSDNAEEIGCLVMVNGVVGSNTRRKLNPREFRGFALVDPLAPTVFVNGADTKAAQVFTLAHELAHIWLGRSGLDNVNLGRPFVGDVETWCNEVAAEFLVPLDEIVGRYQPEEELTDELNRLARIFKVSTLVILRRVYEAGFLEWAAFRTAYEEELDRVLSLSDEGGGDGGNFYNTQPRRVSKTFARAVIADTLEGRTTYSEAFHLLGVRKTSTFAEMGEKLGVV